MKKSITVFLICLFISVNAFGSGYILSSGGGGGGGVTPTLDEVLAAGNTSDDKIDLRSGRGEFFGRLFGYSNFYIPMGAMSYGINNFGGADPNMSSVYALGEHCGELSTRDFSLYIGRYSGRINDIRQRIYIGIHEDEPLSGVAGFDIDQIIIDGRYDTLWLGATNTEVIIRGKTTSVEGSVTIHGEAYGLDINHEQKKGTTELYWETRNIDGVQRVFTVYTNGVDMYAAYTAKKVMPGTLHLETVCKADGAGTVCPVVQVGDNIYTFTNTLPDTAIHSFVNEIDVSGVTGYPKVRIGHKGTAATATGHISILTSVLEIR